MQKEVEGSYQELDPKLIEALPANNARFGLKAAKIKEIADKIVEQGQIQPIEVSVLAEPNNGYKYRLNVGNYRLAAINLLNEQGAGLPIKAIIKTVELGQASVLRNLTENIARQDLTPMDEAVAIKKLMDLDVEKMTIRNMFSRSGRKGPVSNSWLNTTIGFLSLPVKVQNKIHNGEIDWSGAYQLYKVFKDNKEKLPDVLKELEEARQRAIDKDEKEEEKYLAAIKRSEDAERKAQEAQDKVKAAKEARAHNLQTAKDAITATEKQNADLVAKAEKALSEATEKVKDDPSSGAKAVADAVKFLETTKKSAEKASVGAVESLQKLEAKYAAEDAKAKEAVAEAKAAKKEATAAKEEKQPGGVAKKKAAEKPTGAKEVTKAAAAAGASTNAVKLTRKEIMEVVDGLKLPGGSGKAEGHITQIGQLLSRCFDGMLTGAGNKVGVLLGQSFDGILTDKQLYKKLLEVFK